MERRLTRRALLAGAGGSAVAVAGGLALVDRGVLPGQLRLHRALGACDVPSPLPDVQPGREVTGTFSSRRRGRDVGYAIVYPPGARPGARLPVCLYLHGRGGDYRDVLSRTKGYAVHLADRVHAGTPPFALVGVDGGTGYWHARADGDDPGGMLVDELLPLLARRGLATARVGLLGASMGGYGVLLWTQRLGPDRIAAAGALSPALFRRYADAAPGAFDSAADFAAHDVFAGRPHLAGVPVRIDCGRDDPFADGVRAFLRDVPATTTGAITAGCHDGVFWRSVAPAHLERIGAALAA